MNKISHEPLPSPNMKLQTALLRHAIATAKKTTSGKAGKQDPVYQKFKAFCKRRDETDFVNYAKDCEQERLRVFTLMETARHEHMLNASNTVKPLRKEVNELDELIRTLVEKRNAKDAEILTIVKEHGVKWQEEEKNLNDEMNRNLEALAKKYREILDNALLRELPEYCR
jgi:hypothetical protein